MTKCALTVTLKLILPTLKTTKNERTEHMNKLFIYTVSGIFRCILLVDIRFVGDPVQILVQAVQQEGHQFLTVLLEVTTELGSTATKNRLRGNVGLE